MPVNFSQLTLVLKPCHLPCGSTHFSSGLSFSQNTKRTSIIPLTLLVISTSFWGCPPRQPLLAGARGPIAQIDSPLLPSQEPPGLRYSLTSWGVFNSPQVVGSYSNHPAGKKKKKNHPIATHACPFNWARIKTKQPPQWDMGQYPNHRASGRRIMTLLRRLMSSVTLTSTLSPASCAESLWNCRTTSLSLASMLAEWARGGGALGCTTQPPHYWPQARDAQGGSATAATSASLPPLLPEVICCCC